MASNEIIGHARQRQELRQDLDTGNVAHAYLFEGPRHVGKFTVAKWFATELLSEGVDDPDERQHVADHVRKLLHPDVLVLDQLWIEDQCEDLDIIAQSSNVPQQQRAKAHARTDTVGIDDIRILQERLQETGTGRHRVALIRSMERMQAEAINALLKILEEPPSGVVFLLTTQAIGSLLPTLVSRSRTMHFARLSRTELTSFLDGADDDDKQLLLHLAQGAPGTIKILRADPDTLRSERQLFAQALSLLRSTSLAERLQLLSPLHTRGPDADRLLLHLAVALRYQVTGSTTLLQAFQNMVDGFETNASRPLVVERFAMQAGD